MKKIKLYEELIGLTLKIENQFNEEAENKLSEISKKHKIRKSKTVQMEKNICVIN